MSLEQALKENTEALQAMTAALLKGGGAAAASSNKTADDGETSTGRGRGRGRGKASDDDAGKPKYTAEQVKAAAVKVKDELGTKAAKQLISDHGADELAKLKPEQYDAFVEAAEALLNGDDGGNGDDGEL